MPSRSVRCDGVLLTGGASERLGTDKASMLLAGETLAARAARVLTSVCARAIEVGDGVSSLPCVREEPAGAGPLAALLAGADALDASCVLLLAVDLPRVDEPLLHLLAAWPGDGSVLPVADGRPQPVCARWGADALERARVALRGGARSLHVLAEGADVTEVDEAVWRAVAPDGAFADVDTPLDAARLGVRAPR